MRALVVIMGLASGLAGIAAAGAADLPAARSPDYSTRQTAIGDRVAPLVVYDFQPGVVVRAYWRAPWRHRHYFPTTGDKPEVGREEDLSATGGPSEPAEGFQRSWLTSTAVMPELPRIEPPPQAPLK